MMKNIFYPRRNYIIQLTSSLRSFDSSKRQSLQTSGWIFSNLLAPCVRVKLFFFIVLNKFDYVLVSWFRYILNFLDDRVFTFM